MNSALLTKQALTALAAYSYWFSLTPPHRPSAKDTLHVDGLFGFVAHNLSIASKVFVVGVLLCQFLALGMLVNPSIRQLPGLSPLCIPAVIPTALTTLSSLFVFASLLVIAMGVIRAWCYNILGNLFTFQITIRKDHHLVTAGPYAYVRHPGYTALIFSIIGANLLIIDANGWVSQCGLMDTWLRWLIWQFHALCVFSIRSMITRGGLEDDHLRSEFPDEWLTYSARVPYRFIPGLF